MKTVYVNTIIEDPDVTRGVIGLDKTLLESLPILFDENKRNKIGSLQKQFPKDGFHFQTRFCQYVVHFEFSPTLGISILLLDFTNSKNINAAFDYSLLLKENNWQTEDQDKIMGIAHAIKKDRNGEIAKMTIKDLVE